MLMTLNVNNVMIREEFTDLISNAVNPVIVFGAFNNI